MAGISLRDAEAARLQITREQAAEVQGLYRSVYREYRRQLKSLTSGGATSSLRKVQLKKLTEELKMAYESLGRQLEGNITSAVTQTSQAVVQANNSWMSDIGLNITGAYAHVPQDIVALLASGKLYSDGWTLSKAIWGESQQKAHEIDLIVAKGVAANKSAFEIAKDLESYVNPGAIKPWDWSKVYPGTSKKVDYNAQRLARTMVSHAYQQSLERVCNKNPFVIGYKWRSAHTARTCEICNQRSTEDHHGLGPGVYPKGELPLDHPNGMCTFLTVMSDDLEGISNRLADWALGKEDSELDKWYVGFGGSVFPGPELLTHGYKEMSPDEYKKWAESSSTYNQFVLSLEKQLGMSLQEVRGTKDFWIEDQKMWASEWVDKQLEVYRFVVDSSLNRYSYVQNADWSKNINQYFRTGDSKFLVDYFHQGNVNRKRAEALAQEALEGIKKTSKAMDDLISKTTLNQDMTVTRWGGVNSLSFLGIHSDLNTGRIGHSFVTKGLDLEDLQSRVEGLVGSVMVDNGYMSVSASSTLNVFRGSDIKFTLNVPKGTHAFVTDNLEESEIILGRGTKSEITGCRVIETEAVDPWSEEKVKTKSLEIFVNLVN